MENEEEEDLIDNTEKFIEKQDDDGTINYLYEDDPKNVKRLNEEVL